MDLSKNSIFFFILCFILSSCTRFEKHSETKYKTKNVFIIVIDGARYSETWGDSTHKNIPFLSDSLSKLGVINTEFFNDGYTLTIPGHVEIMTSIRQSIDNSGNQFPEYPSFMQFWSQKYDSSGNSAWIITSKDKLEVLCNCNLQDWKNKYIPKTNCGVNGNGTGYRNDLVTFDTLISVLSQKHPRLVLINFSETDSWAHCNNWTNYIKSIKQIDSLAYEIFKFVFQDSFYNGKTTIFITNDHGRHIDTVGDGFVSHGCNCLGCRHVIFYAYGPDFRSNLKVSTTRKLSDISTTIAEILDFEMQYSDGQVMTELFK